MKWRLAARAALAAAGLAAFIFPWQAAHSPGHAARLPAALVPAPHPVPVVTVTRIVRPVVVHRRVVQPVIIVHVRPGLRARSSSSPSGTPPFRPPAPVVPAAPSPARSRPAPPAPGPAPVPPGPQPCVTALLLRACLSLPDGW